MANTLVLNDNWDIQLDTSGNLVQDTGDYAIAQNVACACRAFTKDMYFNQDSGIPHFLTDVSTRLNTAVLATALEKEAKNFEEVSTASFTLTEVKNRVISGDLQITKTTGETINVVI